MKKLIRLITMPLIITGMMIFPSCHQPKELKLYKISGAAQGTYYAITYCSPSNENLQPTVDSLFKVFDKSVSAYLPSSLLSRFNDNIQGTKADVIFETIFNKAMEVSRSSGGAFDITVGPLVNGWGFGFSKKARMDQAVVDSLLPLVGYQKVKLVNGVVLKEDPRIRIDFDAIAQGYTSDWLGSFLESKGVQNYLIDVGGEVLAKGSKPDGKSWNVGIEMPAKSGMDERRVQDVVALRNKAISTSGSYRKYYEEKGIRYSHTIDPFTGYPVRHNLLSVSVMSDNCITADAYATAFMVMGLEKSREFLDQHRELDGYFISDDLKGGFSIYYTAGFAALLK